MELRQLHYLVAVAEESSFTRAAERMRVAQPAISQQIGRLERELGAQLFDRSERRTRLTPAGQAFLPHARATLDATAAGRDAVAALRGVLAGRLTLGTVPLPPPELLDPLRTLHHRHPEVRLRLRVDDAWALIADVVAGAVDTALIGVLGTRLPAGPAGEGLPAVLATAPLATEPLLIVAAPDHPFASRASIAVSALRDESIACLTHGTGLRALLETACAEAGFTPNIRAETDYLTELVEFVAAGFGVALVPRSAAERARSKVVSIELRQPRLHRPMVLIWHRHRIPAVARAFLDIVGVRDADTDEHQVGGWPEA